MKTCPYCGLQNSDEATQCETCHAKLAEPEAEIWPGPRRGYVVSPQEQRFWDRMTFRDLALVFLRIQALWLFLDAAVDATYVPRMLSRWLNATPHSSYWVEVGRDLFWLVVRIALYASGGLAAILYSERFLGWLVKDWVAKRVAAAPPGGASGASQPPASR